MIALFFLSVCRCRVFMPIAFHSLIFFCAIPRIGRQLLLRDRVVINLFECVRGYLYAPQHAHTYAHVIHAYTKRCGRQDYLHFYKLHTADTNKCVYFLAVRCGVCDKDTLITWERFFFFHFSSHFLGCCRFLSFLFLLSYLLQLTLGSRMFSLGNVWNSQTMLCRTGSYDGVLRGIGFGTQPKVNCEFVACENMNNNETHTRTHTGVFRFLFLCSSRSNLAGTIYEHIGVRESLLNIVRVFFSQRAQCFSPVHAEKIFNLI